MAQIELSKRVQGLIGTARGPVEVDWLLVLLVLLLAGLGVTIVYSVTLDDPKTHPLAYKQIVWVALGIVACLGIVLVDYRRLVRHAYPVLAAVCVLLLLTIFLGVRGKQAQRWLAIPYVSLRMQPSEFAKLALILVLSKVLTERRKPVGRLADLWLPALILIPLAVVILKQPDLGTALVLFPISAGMIYAAGLSPFYFLFLIPVGLAGLRPVLVALRPEFSLGGLDLRWYWAGSLAAAVFFGWRRKLAKVDLVVIAILCIAAYIVAPMAWNSLRPYQQDRVLSFLDPEADPMGASYQVRQAQIALGSGGFTGKGWASGTQSTLRFLPEYQTDFVYSALGEQWGFLGTGGILLLFLVLVLRGLAIGRDARWTEGIFLSLGITLYFAVHVLVNVGICLGFLPVTGLPLCFISYGGSATLTNFVAVGLLLNVRLRRFVDRIEV
jgi:rod shape determining protein RodA